MGKVCEVESIRDAKTRAHTCSHCGAFLIGTVLKKGKNQGIGRLCPNLVCGKNLERNIQNFSTRMGISIRANVVRDLINQGVLKRPSDLYSLTEGQLLSVGFSMPTAKKIVGRIEERDQISLARFIYALNIPSLTKEGANNLALHYKGVEEFMNTSVSSLVLSGVSPVVALSILLYLENPDVLAEVKRLLVRHVTITSFVEEEWWS